MKTITLPTVLCLGMLTSCMMTTAEKKEQDLSGRYIANYGNEFSSNSDTMWLTAGAQPGTYEYRSHGVINRVRDGKKIPPEHARTPLTDATFDAATASLKIEDGDITRRYHAAEKMFEDGNIKYYKK